MPRTWGGIEHTLIATTHVTSSWVRAVHLVQVDQTAKAAKAGRQNGDGDHPVQVFDPSFALQLLSTLAIVKSGNLAALVGLKVLPKEVQVLLGILTGKELAKALRLLRRSGATRPSARRKKSRPTAVAKAGTHMAVSFHGGPTCMYPFSDQRDYNLLRAASSVGKAFHRHYYRKGRGLAYYQITAEAARSAMF